MTGSEVGTYVGAPPVLSDGEINRLWRVAEALYKSGMFKDLEMAEQAYAKILIGHDLGLSPTQALMGLHIVEGRPMVSSTMLGAFAMRAGYRWDAVEHTDTACDIHFYRDGEKIGESRFTIEDAERAGLLKPSRNGKPSTHTKYPRNMNFARALSNGVRWFCSDATLGIAVYVEGEIVPESVALTAGEGDAEPVNIDLGPKVEKVIARAEKLGHAALSNRASIELTLGSRSPDVAAAWCRAASVELDALEAEQAPADAEVVSPASGSVVLTHEDLDSRYRLDVDWRERIDKLLSDRADLECMGEEAGDGQANAEKIGAIEDELASLGVPDDYFPPEGEA